MFRSATLKLTGLYLLIIIGISVFFSLSLYRFSIRELDRGLLVQVVSFQGIPGFQQINLDDLQRQRQVQLDEGKQRILWGLVKTNIIIIVLGGVGSYWLARRTLRPIQAAHDAQVRFTADASHELRTPLAALRSEIEVALRDPKITKAQAKDLMKSNLEEISKMTQLSQGLLQLASEPDGQTHRAVALNTVVAGAIERVKLISQQKNIAIDDRVGVAAVWGDELALVQLLAILLDNAIKYSDNGTTIQIRSSREASIVSVSVADQGRGIKATELPRIFDRFYRADSSRSKANVEGYGLGLSIAQKIAQSHGGSIIVASKLAQGSVFTVKLPRLSGNQTT